MSVSPGKILLVVKSARMLAAYLAAVGYEVIAVDCFGDLDTREIVSDYRRVDGLALNDIEAPVNELIERYQPTHALYGSGFERHVDSLLFLHRRLALLGNMPDVFAAVQDKAGFFRTLDELGVEHPEVSFDAPPNDGRRWLLKPHAGEGGLGIEDFRPGVEHASESCYWQRFVDGDSMSVLFVAAGGDISVIGFQRQMTVVCDGHRRFLFAGVESFPELPTDICDKLTMMVRAIAARYGLRGLNGLDFIFSGGRSYPLEINARPTASLQLYGTDVIEAHIQAVLADELRRTARSGDYSSFRIIYAAGAIAIPPGIVWPDWANDRPAPGSVIGQGEPVCSIIARAKTRRRLQHDLQIRQQIIETLLITGS